MNNAGPSRIFVPDASMPTIAILIAHDGGRSAHPPAALLLAYWPPPS